MESWLGGVIGKMHLHKISQEELANELGLRRDYLNKILNGKENPKGVQERVETAVDNIILSRAQS